MLSVYVELKCDFYLQGYENRMQVTVEGYAWTSGVRCDNSIGPPYSSCAKIIDAMNVYDIGQIFGKAGQPNVEVRLPLTIQMRKSLILEILLITTVLSRRCKPTRDAKF